MKYRYVKLPHFICRGKVPTAITTDFGLQLPSCPQALVAYQDGKVVGFFRFKLTAENKHLWAGGTWTHPHFRRGGWADELWWRVYNRYLPEIITVRTATEAGRKFAGSMVQRLPRHIIWHVEA
jgi:hypothetical protein